jgi:hypothetical protein
MLWELGILHDTFFHDPGVSLLGEGRIDDWLCRSEWWTKSVSVCSFADMSLTGGSMLAQLTQILIR